jgi:hypothetical protein
MCKIYKITIRQSPNFKGACPFSTLFPHGNGAYDGNIPFNEYIHYQMFCFFVIFTMCKPYLLLMYDVKQASSIDSNITIVFGKRCACIT